MGGFSLKHLVIDVCFNEINYIPLSVIHIAEAKCQNYDLLYSKIFLFEIMAAGQPHLYSLIRTIVHKALQRYLFDKFRKINV